MSYIVASKSTLIIGQDDPQLPNDSGANMDDKSEPNQHLTYWTWLCLTNVWPIWQSFQTNTHYVFPSASTGTRSSFLWSCFIEHQNMGTSVYSDKNTRVQMKIYLLSKWRCCFLGHDHICPSTCVELSCLESLIYYGHVGVIVFHTLLCW